MVKQLNQIHQINKENMQEQCKQQEAKEKRKKDEDKETQQQLARIRKADLRKQAKGLWKVHLRDCLIDAQTKRQHKRVTAIKQKCNREESKPMWYLIKRTVKDPANPSVLRVQSVVNGEVKEYIVQEDVEQAIQRECEIRFTLAHSAPIMTSLLGKRLRYLSTNPWQN